MLDDYGFEKFENGTFPIAYLITFRTYGTWLHGDKRHSIGRNGKNIYGTPDIMPNRKMQNIMQDEMKHSKIIFDEAQRDLVEKAVRELCRDRKYNLQAIKVLSNHIHAVVSAQTEPERIADAFKAFATKKLREENMFPKEIQIWSRGRSRRYLWKPHQVALAVDYVMFGQGDFDDYAKARTK